LDISSLQISYLQGGSIRENLTETVSLYSDAQDNGYKKVKMRSGQQNGFFQVHAPKEKGDYCTMPDSDLIHVVLFRRY